MTGLPQTDADLLALLKTGSHDAFDQLYDTYWEELYTRACHKLRDPEAAKDVVQDIFVSLWLRRETLLISTSLSAYLATALKYRIINQLEARQTRTRQVTGLLQTLPTAEETTANQLAETELNDRITAAANALPARLGEVFDLSRRQGYSIPEIAQQLGLSEQTIKNQLTTALQKLRLSLHEYLTALLIVLSDQLS